MQAIIFSRNEFPVERGTVRQCEDCGKSFSIFLREHQCKRCFKAVCNECGNAQMLVHKIGYTKRPHRVCKKCREASEYIALYVKNNKLKFAEMSEIGEKWMKKIIVRPRMRETANYKQKIFTKEAFAQLWDSYSPDMRELVGLMTFDYDDTGIYRIINEAYSSVIGMVPQHSIQNVIYLIVFLLCHCRPDKAIIITLYLLQLKAQVKDGSETVVSCLKAFPFNNELPVIMNYLEYRIEKHFNSYLINAVNFESIIYIITKILERRSCEELFYFFASHVFTVRAYLLKTCHNYVLTDYYMVRECRIEDIYRNYKYCKNKNLISYIQTARNSSYGDVIDDTVNLENNKNKTNLMLKKNEVQYKDRSFEESFSMSMSLIGEQKNDLSEMQQKLENKQNILSQLNLKQQRWENLKIKEMEQQIIELKEENEKLGKQVQKKEQNNKIEQKKVQDFMQQFNKRRQQIQTLREEIEKEKKLLKEYLQKQAEDKKMIQQITIEKKSFEEQNAKQEKLLKEYLQKQAEDKKMIQQITIEKKSFEEQNAKQEKLLKEYLQKQAEDYIQSNIFPFQTFSIISQFSFTSFQLFSISSSSTNNQPFSLSSDSYNIHPSFSFSFPNCSSQSSTSSYPLLLQRLQLTEKHILSLEQKLSSSFQTNNILSISLDNLTHKSSLLQNSLFSSQQIILQREKQLQQYRSKISQIQSFLNTSLISQQFPEQNFPLSPSTQNKLVQFSALTILKNRMAPLQQRLLAKDKKIMELSESNASMSKQMTILSKNKEELYGKLNKLSDLMMSIEEEKLQLSDEIFELHEILKLNKIDISKWQD